MQGHTSCSWFPEQGLGLRSKQAGCPCFSLQIFAFDPTVTPERAQALFVEANASALNASFSFMQLGLGASNGVVSFFRSRQPGIGSMTSIKPQDVKWWKYQTSGFQAAVLTLPTIMAALKHDHIDLLKVNNPSCPCQ